MMPHLRLLVFMVFCLMLGGIAMLEATQPFWSNEPSTMEIARADSLTGFDVTRYVIHLRINEQTHVINGNVTAFVHAEENLSFIEYELEGESLEITSVQVNGMASTYTHEDGIIHIPLNQPQGSNFSTTIIYGGVPDNSPPPYNIGLLFIGNYVYTLSNPDAGRYYWPSYDHPWDKALVDWYITVRQDWLVAANGTRIAMENNGDGTRTHHWVSDSPIATYVMGFAAGPYIEYMQQAGDIPIQNFVTQSQLNNAQTDFANVPEMLDFFSDTFGPYPFEKYGHMVVPMATYAAMEHQTMTTFGAAYLTGNQYYESIVAHELAHQWYGNYLTPITMREVWLKESFATYSEFLWEAHHSGWSEGCDYLRDNIQQYYISWENSNGPHTIFNPEYNEMFAPPTYEKSASVLHMLRLKMGNANFFQFIRALLTTYPNSNVNTAEFIDLAEQISGLDLTQFFQQWIYSPGIPNANLSVFTNDAGQAKVVGFSTSPTATSFWLDIPLRLPGSAVADSVVVTASPSGFTSYFAISATDDISDLQIDPNHWVLTRILTQNQMQLASALPYNQAVDLNWSAYPSTIPLQGYKVYRRVLPGGAFILLTSQPVQGLNYTDTTVQNGNTYEYYVVAVDNEGFRSQPSNILSATPIDFPFDMGFLVVDETRSGNGSNISPTDAMVDDFYSYVLGSFTFTQWDASLQGLPSLSTLSHYPLVLWHCDDFTEMQLINSLNTLGSYVLSGGKLLISGWKYPSVFDNTFLGRFLPGITPSLNNSAVFVSAQSEALPDLHPDPVKLAAPWNGMLPMSYVFLAADDALYTAEILGGGTNNGEPAAICVEQTGKLVLLGFPLYFMLQDEVRSFLDQYLPILHPGVAVQDEQLPVAASTLAVYPNPFRESALLNYYLKESVPLAGINIYNLKGQKVRSYSLDSLSKGSHQFSWNGCDQFERKVGQGIYIIELHTPEERIRSRAVLIK